MKRANENRALTRQRQSPVSNQSQPSCNLSPVDHVVNSHRQYLLCAIGRSTQVRAWIDNPRLSKASQLQFMPGYELRVGLGDWFPTVDGWNGEVVAFCEPEPSLYINSKRSRVDLSAAVRGLSSLIRRQA